MTQQPNLVLGTGFLGSQRDQPITIDFNDILSHCLAVGSTESNTAKLVKVLAEEMLVRGVPVVAIDTKGEMAGLCFPASSGVNLHDINVAVPSVGNEAWKGASNADWLRQVIEPRFLGPLSKGGQSLSIPLFGVSPYENHAGDDLDETSVLIEANAIANLIIKRLGFMSYEPSPISQNVIAKVLCRLWSDGKPLAGNESYDSFVQEIKKGKVQYCIGDMEIKRFEQALSRYRFGVGALWLQGFLFHWSWLLSARPGRTPVVIITLGHMEPEERVAAVGAITSSLYKWCRSRGASPDRPRVALVVDELAGDGGEFPLLPIGSKMNYSGCTLMRVLRQGRYCGLSLVASSHRPADCNFRAFNLFKSKFIGKMLSESDIKTLFPGIAVSDFVKTSMISRIKRSSNDQFLIHLGGRNYYGLQVR